MTTSGLADPPRTPARRAPQPEREATPSSPRTRPHPHPSYRRILAWSLGVSVALHALIVLLSPGFLRVGPPPGETGTPYRVARPVPEIRLINPVVSDDAPPEETPPLARTDAPALPEAERRPRAIVPVPGRDVAEAPGEASAAPERSADRPEADPLRPGYRDPRLWVNPRDVPAPAKSDHERYMEHLQARVDALNDSTYGGGPDTDWTFKDKEGRRWGLSPDGLHLGGVTVPREVLPLPRTTGDNQRLMEEREKQQQRAEILRQEEERKRREAQQEAIKAARERQDAARKKGGGGG